LTALWPKVLYMIRQGRDERKSQGQKGQDATARRLMYAFRMGVVFFFSGFAVWIVDGKFCDQLREIRHWLGPPGCWSLEFHGWWHFLTALGAGNFVRVVRELTEAKTVPEKSAGNGHVKAP
jgi:dihydroceramidase